jgi:hypothetical protein
MIVVKTKVRLSLVIRLHWVLILSFFLGLSSQVHAQRYRQTSNFNTSRNWSLNKKEFMFGAGQTTFYGDLGGRNQIGTDYSLVDYDFFATAFTVQVGYRYRFKPRWATTTTLYGGLVRGADSLTQELVRNTRNLSFRSPIVTLNQRLEFIITAREDVGGRYRIPGLNRRRDVNRQLYLFGGIGITYFNPQAEYNGTWYNLRDFHTEGQGLEGGPNQYGRFTITNNIGLGWRWGLNKLWRMGLELSITKCYTDYVDDVSGVYYDPEKLRQLYGDEAAYFSNPAYKNQNYFAPGQQRGDEQNDFYGYLNVVFYRNFTYKPANYKFGRPGKFKTGGRYKF